jgi:anti-sigma factor RsiW
VSAEPGAEPGAEPCAEIEPLLRDAARDRLDQEQARRVAAHLAGCAACRAVADEERALDRRLEAELPQHPAPLGLKRRLAARLPPPPVRSRRARILARTVTATATALAAAACVVLAVGLQARHEGTDPLVAEAVSDHLRVVYRERPVDIESGGPHQVKPWFTGRLDFAIPQVWPGDDEVKLVGGAVGVFGDRKAAELVYKRQLHTLTLFVFPGAGLALPKEPRLRNERGFSVVMWCEGDLGYALVSDVNGVDLQAVARRIAAGR